MNAVVCYKYNAETDLMYAVVCGNHRGEAEVVVCCCKG